VLGEKSLPHMREHATPIEKHFERHRPDQPTLRLRLTDDTFLRSYTW
jgi:hypothetical protein